MLPTFRLPTRGGAGGGGAGGSCQGPMHSKGSPVSSRSSIVVVAIAAGMLVLVSTFFQFHRYLHHAVAEHAEAYKFHADQEGDWLQIYNLAQTSSNRMEFIELLKAGGFLQSSNASLDLYYDRLKDDVETKWTRRGALKGRDQDQEAGRVAGQGSEASLAEANVQNSVNGEPPQISRELAQSCSVNNTIIVTWANFALWDFVKSWALHVRRQGISNILVGAMDAQIGRELVAAGINSFAMYEQQQNHSGVGSDHLQWGGEGFHKMGRLKIALAQTFLNFELNLLLVDVDVVILRNVMDYFAKTPEADILVSSDQLASTVPPGDEGLELPAEAGAPMNIGIMYFRYSQQTLKFVNSWLETINADPNYWDQNAFNDMARSGWDPTNKVHKDNKRVFLGYNDTLYVGVLPVAMFSGGHTYYIQRLFEVQKVEPYAVHCTFQYGGNVGKRNRMREAMIFEDDEEYFLGENYVVGDVTRTPDMGSTEFLALNYTAKKQYNMAGLDWQLESIYPTIGLATLFNRTMIMPRIACYCDRYWTPLEDCRVPGARQQRLPFICPQDYVLDPVFLTDDASKLRVKWREYTFLENPRCPESLRRSKLTIHVSQDVTEPVEKYNVQEGGLVLVLPSSISSPQLLEALSHYTHIKIWHFKDPAATFKGIPDPELAQAYQARIDHLKPIVQPMDEEVKGA